MSQFVVRVSGWREGISPMAVIYALRASTGMSLEMAKGCIDRLRAGGSVELHAQDQVEARVLGQELLGAGIERAELLASQDQASERIEPPPPPVPPAVFLCPACRTRLENTALCVQCGWLRFPSDRIQWGTKGLCPHCGFAYRWDGSRCSHCGFGAEEQEPLVQDA